MIPLPPILETPSAFLAMLILIIQGLAILNYMGFAVIAKPPRLSSLLTTWLLTYVAIDMSHSPWPWLLVVPGLATVYIHFIGGHRAPGTGLDRIADTIAPVLRRR